MSSFDVQSTTGAKVRFYAIALPFTSNQMKHWLDEGDFFRVRHSIDKAIKVARFIGCDVIALGQYTSIVTRNATTLDLPHVGLTTGNSYTIALALEAIERALHDCGLEPASASLAVVGASGNIGQTCAEILAPRFARTVLLGSSKPSALRRLGELQARIPRASVEADAVGAAAGGCRPGRGERADAVPRGQRSSPKARWSAICRCRPRSVPRSGRRAPTSW